MSTDFSKILNWKLLAGSHDFPGPDGGTCINEAALVVAGFAYKRVSSPLDMPMCFSREICDYAMLLNDKMPDGERQKLIPYVPRLAGTADTPLVEAVRKDAINRGVADIARGLGMHVPDPAPTFPSLLTGCGCPSCIIGALAEAGHGPPWDNLIAVLDAALAIGRKPEPIDIEVIRARAEAAKRHLRTVAAPPLV